MLKSVKTSVDAFEGLAVRDIDSRADLELVQSAQKGDQRAFGELVSRYKRLVYSLACAITGNPTEGDEAAQEAFLTAWRKLSELRDPARFRPWLCGITRLVSRHLGYMHRRHKDFEHAFEAEALPSVPSPLDEAIGREEERLIWRALGQIHERYRAPIVLFYLEQQSIQKVAEALDLTESNVAVRLTRGRKMLQQSVMGILESAMSRLCPPKEFTAAVLLAVAAGAPAKATAASTPGGIARLMTPKALLLAAVVAGAGVAGTALFHSREKKVSDEAAVTRASPASSKIPGADRAVPKLPWAGVAEDPARDQTRGNAQVRTPVFNFDFEDGVPPAIFSEGHVVAGPLRPGSKNCLAATFQASDKEGPYLAVILGSFPSTSPIFAYSKDLTISFDYWLGHRGENVGRIAVHMWNLDKKSNYGVYIDAVAGQWVHVEMRVGDRVKPLRASAPAAMDEGDRIGNLYVGTALFEDGFYIDNLKIVD